MAESLQKIKLMVVGECGDGKSTLINNLLGLDGDIGAQTGKNPRGVTKEIQEYTSDTLFEGKQLVILDTPGVGDKDVSAMTLLSLIEAELKTYGCKVDECLDGVIVTSPVTDGRVKLGAQVVQALVEKGFVGKEKWQNIILTGTKMDRAEEDELELFQTGIKAEFYGAERVTGGTCGQTALISKTDLSQLWTAISCLPHMKVDYKPPDVEEMSKALANSLGIDENTFQEKLQQERERADALKEETEKLREETRRQEAARKKLEKEFQDQKKKQEAERIEMDRKLQAERDQREADRKKQEAQRIEMQKKLKAQEDQQKADQKKQEEIEKKLKAQEIKQKKEQELRDLFTSSSNWEECYSDRGTGSRQDLSVWRPRLRAGEKRLMYTCTNSRSQPHHGSIVATSELHLAKPSEFVCVWTDRRTGGRNDGQLWRAVPPSGYVALSDVAVHGSNSGLQPGTRRSADEIDPYFRCVHESLARSSSYRLVWTDAGSCGTYDGATWAIQGSAGMRVSRGGRDSPTGGTYILNV